MLALAVLKLAKTCSFSFGLKFILSLTVTDAPLTGFCRSLNPLTWKLVRAVAV